MSMKRRIDQLGLSAVVGAMVLALGQVSLSQGAQLHDGLISYWALNEGSGASAGDTAPNGAVADIGTLQNSPAWISGMFNAGLQFTGASANQQHVLIPNSADMDIGTKAVTVSTWVKLDALPSGIEGSYAAIFDSQLDNYALYLDKGANELRFKVTDNAGVSTSAHPGVPAALLDTTNWHHVMGVYDGNAGSVKMYFDGGLVDVASMPTVVGLVRTGQVSGIGAQPTTDAPHTPSNFYEGGVSDVALWNRALGAAEAQYLYNSGVGNAVGASNPDIAPLAPLTPTAPSAQPVIYYPFDGDLTNHGTGGAALDAVLHDAPGQNDNLFTNTSHGKGLDLRENPDTPSTADNGDYLSVDYTLPEQGTIELRFTADKFYNYQTLWSNSVHGNAWESWIYDNGRLAARANEGSSNANLDYLLTLSGGLDTNHHIAFTWERDGAQLHSRLYVDGELKEQAIENWRDPGATFFLAGGLGVTGGANDLGSGVYDEFRIYDVALSDSEVLFRSQVPEPGSLILACMAAVLAGACRLRGTSAREQG